MKYYGKEKCKILKQIRAEIARQNDIEWVVSECKHQGNCRGTCPKCEYEVRQLEAALARREALGKKVAVVGISAGIALSVTGCDISLLPSQTLSGEPLPPEQIRQTDVAVMGEELPPETVADTAVEVCDGEMPDIVEDTELSTEVLMGDVYIPEDEPLGGVPMPPEDETDEWVEMGEPMEPMPGEEPETLVPEVMPDDWVESETETFEDEIQIPHEAE